jgi:hypothetical protein
MADSQHFENMLRERSISRNWADRAVDQPDRTEQQPDGTVHYLKRIEEYDNRWLRVVVNEAVQPVKRITAFFDRRLRREP